MQTIRNAFDYEQRLKTQVTAAQLAAQDPLRARAIAAQNANNPLATDLPNERTLIQRAINCASAAHQGRVLAGEDQPAPRWAIVKHLFCCGSTLAAAICTHYGYDPNKEIGLDKL